MIKLLKKHGVKGISKNYVGFVLTFHMENATIIKIL